jgi:peptidoglycan/xylan/chitin deacetylase (PgdA/CDA1 family)
MRDSLIGAMSRGYQCLDCRGRLLVVTLHRVGGHSAISPESIKQQLAFVAEHYKVIRPCQFDRVDRHQRLAMITIDDGHADTYRHVFPVARALGIPIAMCPSTDFLLRGRWLWFDKLSWAVSHAGLSTEWVVGQNCLRAGEASSVAAFETWLKQLLPDERGPVLDEVIGKWHLKLPAGPTEEYRPVSREELREMQSSGLLEVCAHTVTHTIATRLSDAELQRELAQSKRELEELTENEVVAFCYPNGEDGDFDERTGRAVLKAGFRMAFTSIEGLNWRGKMNPLQLKRIHAHRRTGVFLKEASGLGDFQRLLRLPCGPGRTGPPSGQDLL